MGVGIVRMLVWPKIRQNANINVKHRWRWSDVCYHNEDFRIIPKIYSRGYLKSRVVIMPIKSQRGGVRSRMRAVWINLAICFPSVFEWDIVILESSLQNGIKDSVRTGSHHHLLFWFVSTERYSLSTDKFLSQLIFRSIYDKVHCDHLDKLTAESSALHAKIFHIKPWATLARSRNGICRFS